MITFQITPKRRRTAIRYELQKGDAETIKLDFGAWAKTNGAVSSATWTVQSGNVSVSGAALASNVASAILTGSDRARARITVSAVSGSQTISITLLIRVIEPIDVGTWDYGYLNSYL